MSQFIVKDEGYTHSTPEGWTSEAQAIGYMPALLAAGEKFLELDKALADIPDEGITEYHRNVCVTGIVLGIEGDPWGVIMYLDDHVQFVPFKSTKNEESK